MLRVFVIFAILCLSAYAALGAPDAKSSRPKPAPSRSHKVAETPLSAEEQIYTRVYRQANRGVVNLTTLATPEELYFGITPQEGTGSGSIISPEGYILTNNHVVAGVENLRVTLFDGTTLPASVIGTDPDYDLAVLKIDPPAGTKLTVIPLGDSSALEVGRKVLAIGNPFGLDRTLTVGIISSLGRTLNEGRRLIKGIIQTDAAINPGNSGGPLLDTQGRMIGINTAIVSRTGQSAGIGFAIPINTAKRIIPELIAHHRVIRPELGIEIVQPLEFGLRIMKLSPGGPAARAGLSGPKVVVYRQGPFTFRTFDNSQADVIVSADNVPIKTPDDLLSYVEERKPGDIVTLGVLRQGKLLKIPVKLTISGPA